MIIKDSIYGEFELELVFEELIQTNTKIKRSSPRRG